jgi:uncharacterized integral membrane protein
MPNLIAALLVAFWVSAIALISVQNAQTVTVNFLQFQTVPIPVGVVLAFCVAIGIAGTALVLPFWQAPAPRPFDDSID